MAKPERLSLLLFFIVLAQPFPAAASWEPPERGLSAAFAHTGVLVGPHDDIRLSLIIRNTGRLDDSFKVTVLEKPEGWETELRSFTEAVSGLFLPGLDQAKLTLDVRPPNNAQPEIGDYLFKVKFESLDGTLVQESQCLVTVRVRDSETRPLSIQTSHPQVRGPSDSRFSFSLEVNNQSGEDSLVSLSADAPAGWEAWFKPGYEDKQVSSIQIPQGQSRALNLDVSPGFKAKAGSYPLKVRAESKSGSAEAVLTVELTGTYQIRLMPANELLSASTEAGKPVSMNFFVINEGTAAQREVRFITVAPDNWKVEFKPDSITGLEPGRTPAQITMTVTPADNALIGDYGLGLAAEGERSKSALDLRITVKAKTAWAWAGVALIAMAVGGLAVLFRRLGRR